MIKPVLMAVGGVLAGVAVAAAIFFFVFADGEAAADTGPRDPVSVAGRLGPHVVLADRVFNLQAPSSSQAYLKLQVLVEFETRDTRWAHVLNDCVAASYGVAGDALVSVAPAGRAASGAPAEGEDACAAKEHQLLAEFEREIGTGIHLMEDAVTRIVTAYSVQEITSPEGKERLRDQIRQEVDALMGERQTVTRVLFLNFITQ